MKPREKTVYKEYLQEEEKFLKGLERHVQDHINKLKVEELSLLKLISDTSRADDDSINKNQQATNFQDENQKNFEATEPKHEMAEINQEFKTELEVNSIPLDLNIGTINTVKNLNCEDGTAKLDKTLENCEVENESESEQNDS